MRARVLLATLGLLGVALIADAQLRRGPGVPPTTSGTLPVSGLSNATTDITKVGGTAVSTGTGAGGAGIPRVTVSSDSSLAANQSVNAAQFGGTNVSTGTGAGGAGIPRVTVSSDSSLAANQSVNMAQVGGTNTVNGGLAGSLSVGGTAASDAVITANPILTGGETLSQGSQPAAATSGRQRRLLMTVEGAQFVQEGSSNRFSCFVEAVTVLTQCQAAPSAGLRAYVTSIALSNEAATVQTLDIIFGTGSNCATGPTALTHKFQFGTVATTTSPFVVAHQFTTPLVPTAANAICVRPSAATAFGATLTGFIAP